MLAQKDLDCNLHLLYSKRSFCCPKIGNRQNVGLKSLRKTSMMHEEISLLMVFFH